MQAGMEEAQETTEMVEDFPVHETIKVIKGLTFYRSTRFWKAALLTESFGKRQISVYLWVSKDGHWKRKQKYTVKSRREWLQDSKAITELFKDF